MKASDAESAELRPDSGWLVCATPRLPPPPPAERGWLFRAISLGAARFGRSEIPDLFPVLHIHRRLFWPWLLFASRLMPRGRLDAKTREKLILRTGWNCRCRYEWGQHVDIGLRVGLSDADIVRVARGPEHATDADERALLAACDDMAREQRVSDAVWSELATRFDRVRLIEIVMLIGHYQMVAGFLNSSGIALEPTIERALADFHQRIASV
jgi:4-carboxymuconolactone decarboxylase